MEYKPLLEDHWREAAVYGGRFSLKSHSVARILLIRARQKQRRIGCFREFQNSIKDSSHQLLSDLISYYKLTDFKITDNAIVNTLTKSDFLFKGLRHNEQSIKSIEGLDIAWVEEAQTVSESSLEILTPTVRKDGSQIIYTYNRRFAKDPVHKRLVLEGRPNTLVINVNYDIAKKYRLLPKQIEDEIESDKLNRPSLYQHKWLGEPLGLEGKIYKDWAEIEQVPHEARLERIGLDFGYSNDPTAIVGIYYYNGGYILNEITYLKGLSNRQISEILKQYGSVMVVADSAEPKSIDEIKAYGVNIIPTVKGKDSIRQGIQLVQDQRISVTKRSRNILSEYETYLWKIDDDGTTLNMPFETADHAMDAIRYGFDSLRHIEEFIDPNVYNTTLSGDIW